MAVALVAKRLPRSKPAFETVSVVAEEIQNYHEFEWLVPGTGIEPVWLAPRDFKQWYMQLRAHLNTVKH